jgi:hypothetical protein
MTLAQLEHRISELEQKVMELAAKVETAPANGVKSWIDEIHGTFQDTATYRQAARYGSAWRKRSPSARSRPPKAASR